MKVFKNRIEVDSFKETQPVKWIRRVRVMN